MKNKSKIFKFIFLGLALLICVALFASIIPVFASYKDSERLVSYIESFGIWGFFVLLFIQIFQIVIAFIPGELVEFVAGTLYGSLLGTLACFIGILAGQALIFFLVKWMGTKFTDVMISQREFKKLKFLNDEKKLSYTIFLLYFIPGTPKDVLTYFVPMTKIKFKKFMSLSCIARIPSVLSSVYAGATFADGDFVQTLIIYTAIGGISVLGLALYSRFTKKGEKNGTR